MKATYILLPILLASATTACVTTHVYMQNCFISGDTLSTQAFDNGIEVCNGGKTIHSASSNTEFCIDGRQSGYSFCVTRNGRTGSYKNGDEYSVTMTASGYDNKTLDCAVTDDATFNGVEYESCMPDNYFNCGSYAAYALYNFKTRF
jgi:hypothetical protein